MASKNKTETLPIGRFLELSDKLTVIDVRAPNEFSRGHIPGAVNIPLFNDIERARVGAAYHLSGQEAAIMKGLEFVGPKMVDIVKKARQFAKNKALLVHCWRGGMRSESMAWLFSTAGLQPHVLQGGYKAYRSFIRENFRKGPALIILGGKTGSGKTGILQYLREMGEQVIDLEKLAHHKGSAYGSIGEAEQPTNEQFENILAAEWALLDPSRPVWLEDESLQIGKVSVPKTLFDKMREAPVIFLDVDTRQRVDFLVSLYVKKDIEVLKEKTLRISKRLGGQDTKRALEAIDRGDLEEAAALTLRYYDKAYMRGLSQRDPARVVHFRPSTSDHKESALEVLRLARSIDQLII